MGVLFWGNRKLFSRNDGGVRLALKHPLLKHQPVIGRGVYSVILGDESSVFKLTIDRAAYALAEHQSEWRCSALPVIRGLHGIVGALDYGVPLFLVEMESLIRLEAGTTARKRCLSIGRQLRQSLEHKNIPSGRLRHVSTRHPDDEISRALLLLADFLESRWPAADLDLHGANFMRRPNTGEAVITDPIMDVETRNIVLQNYKLGLPAGTVIL
ncbi:hypothetical protein SCT_1015 [Sulfuricella sp. T08]|uniref:hypothetical protein n=1 Tax=Sulfuricella sp. T08 TaxID=1632857 RepID=UPI0006179E25|nr:hypothetical protein [Sulfuricella sp. T08]GAO35624.1 hypothetical protein SCT_1015 [Sulfuricella sp. T08]